MTKNIRKNHPGLFDYENRMEKLGRISWPLERLNERIDFEMFRPQLEEMFEREAKGPGGRPRYDLVMMFKVLVLQRYYNLSDEQAEYQINDRLSFQRFLGLDLADTVPDQKTIWAFREQINRDKGEKKLFARFDRQLRENGLVGREGKIVDASFVDVPRQRNSRDDNDQIKSGEIPESFKGNKPLLRQKDMNARWTKKGQEVHYGYKNHVKANSRTKLIEKYTVTDASVHDSQVLEDLMDEWDEEVYADSAYRGEEIEEKLRRRHIRSSIHEKGYRNHPLSEDQKRENRKKSKIRARIEHIFGYMTNSMFDGLRLRFIGERRNAAGIGLLNLVYNMFRYEQILRLNLV